MLDKFRTNIFAPVILGLTFALGGQTYVPAQENSLPSVDLKEISMPADLMSKDDKKDEQTAAEILKGHDLTKPFVRVYPRELHKEARDAYGTMIENKEFKDAGFNLYTQGDKVFFHDRKKDGELFLVDLFTGKSFEFAKIHHLVTNPQLKDLLQTFNEVKSNVVQKDIRSFDDRLKERIDSLGTKVTQKDKELVLNVIKEWPSKILEDFLDEDWGWKIKLVDHHEVQNNPSLILDYMATKNQTLSGAKSIAYNSGAFYNATSNAFLGGDLVVFTGGIPRLKSNVHHEMGHVLDSRLKYHFLTDKKDLAKNFDLKKGDSFGISDASQVFLTDHQIDIERLQNNYSSLTSGNDGYSDHGRINYYDDGDVKSLSKLAVNKQGAVETFAENIATHLDRENDPLANFFKKVFERTMTRSKELTEAVYGKGIFNR